MLRPLISIIIPIYKAQDYLQRCVDSMLCQTFKEFELILVDDGSPDNSGKICDDYSIIDSRIRVIHKVNGGVSSARQCGLDNAVGDFVIHADPDDWAEPEMLKTLYYKAIEENADLVMCDYWINNTKEYYVKQAPLKLEPQNILKEMLGQKLHGACWNKLIKRELFKKYEISFPLDIIRWEDLWVTCSLLVHPIKISYVPKAFYHYDQCINSESIVRKITLRAVESQIRFCQHFNTTFQSAGYTTELNACKVSTKELMFRSRLYTSEVICDTFAEVNEDYISRNYRFSLRNLDKLALVFVLNGNPSIGVILDNLYLLIKKVSNFIKRK